MADRPPAHDPGGLVLRRRTPRPPLVFEVLRRETVGDGIIRVVIGGPGFDRFQDNGFTDRYVKLQFAPEGIIYDDPTDVETIAGRPPAERPRMRTYTIRWIDDAAKELAIDFVLHGDAGIAARWARHAAPGEQVVAGGPGGAYRPDPAADWHLFVADDAALPAVAAALDDLPDDAAVVGVVALDVPGRAAYLGERFADRFQVIDRVTGPSLTAAVEGLELPGGEGHAFVHTELGEVRSLRTLLRGRFSPERLSLSGYWREGKDEDGFQAEKRAEAEAATAPAR